MKFGALEVNETMENDMDYYATIEVNILVWRTIENSVRRQVSIANVESLLEEVE